MVGFIYIYMYIFLSGSCLYQEDGVVKFICVVTFSLFFLILYRTHSLFCYSFFKFMPCMVSIVTDVHDALSLSLSLRWKIAFKGIPLIFSFLLCAKIV